MVPSLDHGMLFSIRAWPVAVVQWRFTILSLFGQEFLHAFLRAEDVIHEVEIIDPPYENLLRFFGQRNDLDLKPLLLTFMFTVHRKLIDLHRKP